MSNRDSIRTAKTSVIKNILNDSKFLPWREEALKRGYVSSIALPIIIDEKVLGALNIYAVSADAFDKEEKRLFEKLTENLSFGIGVLRLKKVNENIANKNTQLGYIFEESLNEIYLFDEKTLKFVEVNRAAQKNLGYTMEELRQLTPVDIKPQFTSEVFSQLVESLRTGEKKQLIFETIHERKDKTLYYTEVHLQLIKNEDVHSFLAIILDITKRKEVEEKIHKLSRVVKQSSVSIMITDLNGNIDFVNQKFLDVTGYMFDEVKGQNPRFLKSGFTSQQEYADMWKVITQGHEWKGEFCNKKKSGQLFWEFASISPMKNSEGVMEGFLAIKEEITEQKRLQEQLLQSQKMESIGALAGGIAHDFNNFLAIISGYTELIMGESNKNDLNYKRLTMILSAAEKSAYLTEQLLLFSRQEISEKKVFHLNKVIKDLGKMLERLIGDNIQLVININTDKDCVKADSRLMEQALMNIIVNARDAMAEGGVLIIEVDNIFNNFEKQGYVKVSISDTGVGIAPELKSKIFEPFVTTKERGKGTGLGLSTSYGIIKSVKGYIDVESTVGKGTSFYIYLPFEQGHICNQEEPESLKREDLLGNEKILFVDDTKDLRELVSSLLQKQGYTIMTVSSGKQALELINTNKEKNFDLLVTDIVMFGMGGRELVEKVKVIQPNIKVIFTSGYTNDIILRQGIEAHKVNFIKKPFKNFELFQKIRNVLDKGNV